MNNYFVYCYFDPMKISNEGYILNNLLIFYEPFYVGLGKNNRHLSHLNKAKKDMGKKIKLLPKINKIRKILTNNLEPIIIKIYENLNFETAKKLEISLISQIGSDLVSCVRNGPLLNLTAGGEGSNGYIYSEDRKKACSIRRKKQWQNPLYKESLTKQASDQAKKNNERMKTDLEYNKKFREKLIEANKRPEVKERRSNGIKKMWQNPEIREKKLAKQKEVNSRPEIKAKRSEINRERWKNPEFKAMMAQKSKDRWADPDYKKRTVEKSKEARKKIKIEKLKN